MVSGGAVFVEFFFALSGYFTALHFDKACTENIDELAKKSITYTWKKFGGFLPYTIPLIFVQYVIMHLVIYGKHISINSLFFFSEMLLDIFWVGDNQIAPLWYLSAMFIAFPVFCLLCQCRWKHLLYIISFVCVTFWCKYTEVLQVIDFPLAVVRALVFLLLGVLIYGISEFIKKYEFTVFAKTIFTLFEQGCMLFAVYIAYLNKGYRYVTILCFAVGLILMLSGRTYTCQIRGRFFTYLGEISMVIYLVHWVIGSIIKIYMSHLPINQQVWIYYMSIIITAIIMHELIERVVKRVRIKRLLIRS